MNISVEDLIKILPDILMFILPGWIFLQIYCLFIRKFSLKLAVNIETILLSYILQLSAGICYGLVSNNQPSSAGILTFSALAGTAIGFIRTRPWFEKIIGKKIGLRLETSIWEGIIDRKKGVYVRVFLVGEDNIYKGAFSRYFSADGETWIELQAYTVRKISGKSYANETADSFLYSYKGKAEHMVAINVKNISRIELLYDTSSEKIQ